MNPFETPAPDSPPDAVASNCWIDGKYLVVNSRTQLPNRCAKTNVPVGPDEIRKISVASCSPIWALLFVVSGFLFFLVWLLVRRECVITVGLTRKIRRRYLIRKIANAILTVVFFFAIPVSGATWMNSAIPPLIAMALFIASSICLIYAHRPFAAIKSKHTEFWVSGFSKEYLANVAALKR